MPVPELGVLPFSAAAERNREPILAVLRAHLADRRRVLEIGSGTGQHAVHFAAALPQLVWQCSDRADYLASIAARLQAAALPNTPPPLRLDVGDPWPTTLRYDAVYTANTLHIMGWPEVQTLFARLPDVVTDDAVFLVYGPFREHGVFDADSNAAFDASLRAQDPQMGLRDLEAVRELAAGAGFRWIGQQALPANNRCLIWRR